MSLCSLLFVILVSFFWCFLWKTNSKFNERINNFIINRSINWPEKIPRKCDQIRIVLCNVIFEENLLVWFSLYFHCHYFHCWVFCGFRNSKCNRVKNNYYIGTVKCNKMWMEEGSEAFIGSIEMVCDHHFWKRWKTISTDLKWYNMIE